MQQKRYSLDGQITVEGAENTGLNLKLAGLGSRMLAYILDFLIQSVSLFFLLIFFNFTIAVFPAHDAASYYIAAVNIILVFIVFWGYFIIFELAWKGQTPGKKAFGIKVVQDDGRPVTVIASFLRNILRVADFLPFSYAAGIISIFVSSMEKRLGDMAAGTIVIKTPKAVRPFALNSETEAKPAPISEDEALLEKRGHHLTVADTELLRDFLQRRSTLEPESRHKLADRLAFTLAFRLNVEVPANPEKFLEQLAASLQKKQ